MKIPVLFAGVLIAGCILPACEKVVNPFEDMSGGVDTTGQEIQYNDTTYNDTVHKFRTILIEDYTGHTCGYCPLAAEEAQRLHDLYGDTVLIAGIHAGGFAEVQSTGDKYQTDFRIPASEAYDQQFQVSAVGNPNGIINRLGYPGNIVKGHDKWDGIVSGLISDPAFNNPEVSLVVQNIYNSRNRNNIINLRVNINKPVSGARNVLIWVTESGIVDWQKDYTRPSGQQDVANFVHNHVLRAVYPSTWGAELYNASAAAGTVITEQFSFNMDPQWKAENTEILVIVYDAASYEVIQAASVKPGIIQ